MEFIIILGMFLIFANTFLPKANVFSLRESANNATKECLKAAVEVIENENITSISDFHEKSDMEKMKALYKETVRMMENGTKPWKTFKRIFDIALEELGGEVFVDNYFQNYTAEFAKDNLNSVKICELLSSFGVYYKKANETVGTSVGASDKFWPMVKDMMTSADLEHTDIKEVPAVFYGSAVVMVFGQPDETIDHLALLFEVISERYFRNTFRETGTMDKPFPFTEN